MPPPAADKRLIQSSPLASTWSESDENTPWSNSTFSSAATNLTAPSSTTSASSSAPRQSTSETGPRARSASATNQLSQHVTQGRNGRKKMFLDRLRQRRDDDRDARVGDQVLRMDFVRQRREWEDMMARRAVEADVDEEGDEEMEVVMEMEMQGGMSPPDDSDGEVEELLSYLPEDVDDPIVDDDEYDALFMEVLGSQEQSDQHQHQHHQHQHQPSHPWADRDSGQDQASAAQQHQQQQHYDVGMDMS